MHRRWVVLRITLSRAVVFAVLLLCLPGAARANGLGALAGCVSAATTCLVVSAPLAILLLALMVAPRWIEMTADSQRLVRHVALYASVAVPLLFPAVIAILAWKNHFDHWARKGLAVVAGAFEVVLLILAGLSFYLAY